MCGRVQQKGPELPGLFSEMGATEEDVARAWKAHHNGAPTQWLWVIHRAANSNRNLHTLMRWGLIPSWTKDLKAIPLHFNARAEGIQDKPAFRAAYRWRRCLIPVGHYFEWNKVLEGGKPIKGRKQPYAIALKSRQPYALAGIWETWTDRDTGQVTQSFAIVTTEPNSLVAQIHTRMPVIVAPENYERWLACVEPDPADLFVPYPAELMDMWPVSDRMNSASYNEPDVAEPVYSSSKVDDPTDLFSGDPLSDDRLL